MRPETKVDKRWWQPSSAVARPLRLRRPFLRLSCLAVVLIAGCGGSSGTLSGTSPSRSKPVTLTVSSLPILDCAPYFWAIQTGMFRNAGLIIKNETSTGGAAALPGLLRGDIQIDFSNVVTALLARERGLPVRLIGGGSASHPTGRDTAVILVAPKSPIKTAHAVRHKTIAVNDLSNIDQVYTEAWLRSKGVTPKSVGFLAIPFPDQPLALLSRKVDAVDSTPPFSDSLEASGARVLGYPFQVQPHLYIAGWLTTDANVARDRGAFEHFVSVLTAAAVQIRNPANHQRLLQVLHNYTQESYSILEKTIYPLYILQPDSASLTATAQVMEQEGLVRFQNIPGTVDSLVGKSG
jgi:NitT/TauT family transport system substrate-binding protein